MPFRKDDKVFSVGYDDSQKKLEGFGRIIFNYMGNVLTLYLQYYEGAPTIFSEDDINRCPECRIQTYFQDLGTKSQTYSKVLNIGDECIQLVQVNKLWYIPGDFNQFMIGGGQLHINNLHLKLAHANPRLIKKSINHGTITASKKEIKELDELLSKGCVDCMEAKARRANAIEGSRDYYLRPIPFDVVYSDVCIVKTHTSVGEMGCFVTFKDQYTKYTTVFMMKHKSDVARAVDKYVRWVSNQFSKEGYRVHKIFSDKGTEYLNAELKTILEREGIELHTTSGYTSASNGVAERLNLTIMNDARAMLHSGKVSHNFWKEAVLYSVFVRNNLVNDNIGTSPSLKLKFMSPKTKDLHIFGEICEVTYPPKYTPKLGERAVQGIYLGWSNETFGCQVFIPNTPGDTRYGTFTDTRHVQFMNPSVLYTDYFLTPQSRVDDSLQSLYDPRIEIFADLSADDASSDISSEVPSIVGLSEGQNASSIPVDRKLYDDAAMETELSEDDDHSIVTEPTLRAGSPIVSSSDDDYESDSDWVPDSDDNSDILSTTSSTSEDYSDDIESAADLREVSNSEEPQTIQASDEKPTAETTMLFDLDAGDHSTPQLHYRKPNFKKPAKGTKPKKVSSKPAPNVKRSPMVGHAGKIKGAKHSMPQAPKENVKAERSTATSTDDNPVVGGKESNNLATSRVTVPENMEALSTLNRPLPVVEPEKFAVSDSPSLNAGEKDYQRLTGHNHTESKHHTTTRHLNIPLQAEHEDDRALLNSSLDGEVNHSKLPQVTSPHDTLADKSGSSGHKISFQVIPATSAGEKVKTEKGSSRWNKSKFSSLEPFRTGTRLSRKHTYDDLVNGDTRSSVPLINSTPGESSAPERTYMVARKKPRIFQVLLSDIYLAANPKGYKQAMCSKDAAKWKAAIDDEFHSHHIHNTWDRNPILTDDPKILNCCVSTSWVFTVKSDGRRKARLVARGDHQKENTYSITFSPTLRPEIMRAIFALIATQHWFMAQFDVKTAYLYSPIDTELYIYQPQGYSTHTRHAKVPSGMRVVYKLNKALYGLKQSGNLWHKEIQKHLAKINFESSHPFPSTYIHKDRNGKVDCVVGLFVDDIIVGASNKAILDKVYKHISGKYELKTIQPDKKTNLQKFLGIDLTVERLKDGRVKKIKLCQSAYIEEFVEKLHLTFARSCATPLSPNFYFDTAEHPLEATKEMLNKAVSDFRRKIGCLLYVAVMTRPDIAYAVDYLARFSTYPHRLVVDQLKHVLNYLYHSRFKSIIYQHTSETKMDHLICYSDSDYAQNPITRKSMNGFLIMFSDAPLYWKCQYTPLVCKSSTEAELQAIYLLSNELEWFHPLMKFMSAYQGEGKYPELLVDNKSAVDTIVYGNFSPKSKPYAVRLKCLEERFEEKRFIIKHVSTKDQLADILTKPITTKVLGKLRSMIIQMLQIKGACRTYENIT